jgi:superfamily II DNA or RNA helicase
MKHLLPPTEIVMRDYQQVAINDTDRLLATPGNNTVITVLPTGAGKSLVKAYYARRYYERGELTIIFAHRDVLLGQISDKCCLMKVPHTFICSDKTRRNITNDNLSKYGDSYWDENSHVIVVSVPTFLARIKSGIITREFCDSVKYWMLDECFPAGTLVDGKPIETFKVGDYVTSFNEKTLNFSRNKILKIHKNKEHAMLCRIKAGRHHVVDVTTGHPFFTDRGWVKAINLRKGDFIYVTRNTCNFSSLPHVRFGCENRQRIPKAQGENKPTGLLFEGVFQKICIEEKFGNNDTDKLEVRFGTYEKEQPYEKCGIKGKDESNPHKDRSQTTCPWWEWSWSNESRVGFIFELETPRFYESGDSQNSPLQTVDELSCTLQGRLWEQGFNDCDRGRRGESLLSKTTGTGQEEDVLFDKVRVDSVEVFQPRDNREYQSGYSDGYVYNFEVENDHTYIANGFMVHNCHHLLSSDVYNDCDGDIDAMWEAVRSGEGKLGNQWGVCTELLSNARGLGVTATPKRGDKKGLGSHADGHADAMSVTTTMFDLIKGGHLTPYEIYTTGTIDVKGIKHNKDGDLNSKQLYIKTKEADITGDAVAEYRKHLDGKPVITFCVNVEHAKEVAKAFNDAGIPSMMVNANTADAIRQKAVADLRDGRILNLVNVDLFGEGFDAPAVAGVIMMRRTESYSLFKQQFGRMLRPAPGKSAGILIDMVGNVKYFMVEYGLIAPHDDPEWTLDNERQNKKSQGGDDDGEGRPETITCGNKMCMAFGLLPVKPEQVEKFRGTALLFIDGKCPKCGWCESEKEKTERKTELKYQKGDLVKLELSVIDELIKQRDHALMDITEFGRTVNGTGFAYAAKAQFARRQHALNVLRFKIQKWCEVTGTKTGQAVPLVQADFEIKFGVNIFKAQAGTASEMERLAGDIEKELVRL